MRHGDLVVHLDSDRPDEVTLIREDVGWHEEQHEEITLTPDELVWLARTLSGMVAVRRA